MPTKPAQAQADCCWLSVAPDDPWFPQIEREREFCLVWPPPPIDAPDRRAWVKAVSSYNATGVFPAGWLPAPKIVQDDAPAPQDRGVTPPPASPSTPTPEPGPGVTPPGPREMSGQAIPLDMDRVRELAAEGNGYRVIARIMEEETGEPVSHMTVKRRLKREETHGPNGSPTVRRLL